MSNTRRMAERVARHLAERIDGAEAQAVTLLQLAVSTILGGKKARKAFEDQIKLVVRRVQVVQDHLERGGRLDVVANGQQQPMRHVHDDRDFVEVVRESGRFHLIAFLHGVQRTSGALT